jgi:hypothetical protein
MLEGPLFDAIALHLWLGPSVGGSGFSMLS